MRVLAALVAALALAGCGLQLPTSTATTGTNAPRARSPQVPPDNEVPTPPARAERAPGAATPAAAVRAFAQAYINWTAADVAARLRALARTSVGQARTELRLEASETRADKELHRGGIANAGVVEAVARLRKGGGTRYVVVTRERTTANADAQYVGLAPAWHVAVATLRAVDGGRRWVVSGWQPQS